jgi:hypothetical protein
MINPIADFEVHYRRLLFEKKTRGSVAVRMVSSTAL